MQEPYSFSKISKQDKTGKSIFGKLYLLRDGLNKSTSVKLAIVSNAFLKIKGTIYSNSEIVHFSCLDTPTQKEICKALSKELGSNIDLSEIDFIYTSMNLLNPENDLKGKIVGSFEKIMGIITPGLAAVIFYGALRFFECGLRRYEGSGS